MRPDDGSETDDRLLQLALWGDAAAFGRLCERHRDLVWRVAASVADGSAADDIAQDTVVRAYRALQSYRWEAPFPAWLCRIALNAAHDYRRSSWFRRVRFFDDISSHLTEERDPRAEAMGRITQREIRRAVASLPERERTAIWLHYFEGVSFAEIARLCGSHEATIRSRVKAGLRRLREGLGDLEPEAGGAGLREAEPCR